MEQTWPDAENGAPVTYFFYSGIGLVSDAAKDWTMIGELSLNGGSIINELDQFNLRGH